MNHVELFVSPRTMKGHRSVPDRVFNSSDKDDGDFDSEEVPFAPVHLHTIPPPRLITHTNHRRFRCRVTRTCPLHGSISGWFYPQ
jgi:hypothetical protein